MHDNIILKLEHVQKTFSHPARGVALTILRDVDLELIAGESVAIVGPSGSGKSTLLNIIGTLDRPTSGRVELAGMDLSRASEKTLNQIRNRDIGFVFQQHHLMPQLTVWENILLPTLPAGKSNDPGVLEWGRHLLESVGLADRTEHRPGLLSGGECQRMAVVRALINQPKLLLADEPTGSLDGKTAMQLQELLVKLNQKEGITLLVATHSMELAGKMGKLYKIEEARLNRLKKQACVSDLE